MSNFFGALHIKIFKLELHDLSRIIIISKNHQKQ